jgi:hypothetical protein
VAKDRPAANRHGGGTGVKADIALEIGVLHPIDRGVDAVKVKNLELIIGAIEVGGDFHRTGSGIIAGVAGRVPDQRFKGAAEPISPHIGDLAAGVIIAAKARWIELVHDKYGLRPGGTAEAAETQQSDNNSGQVSRIRARVVFHSSKMPQKKLNANARQFVTFPSFPGTYTVI